MGDFQKAEELRKQKRREKEKQKFDKQLERERREEERLKELERIKREHTKRKAEEAKRRGKEIMFQEPESGNVGGDGGRRGKKRKNAEPEEDLAEQDEAPPNKVRKFNHMGQFDKHSADENENDILNESGETKKKLKKKKKKKNKKKKSSKDKKKKQKEIGKFDDAIWSQMAIKIEEIVRNADLNTLTNRQVKDQLREQFVGVNMKIYKAQIK